MRVSCALPCFPSPLLPSSATGAPAPPVHLSVLPYAPQGGDLGWEMGWDEMGKGPPQFFGSRKWGNWASCWELEDAHGPPLATESKFSIWTRRIPVCALGFGNGADRVTSSDLGVLVDGCPKFPFESMWLVRAARFWGLWDQRSLRMTPDCPSPLPLPTQSSPSGQPLMQVTFTFPQ